MTLGKRLRDVRLGRGDSMEKAGQEIGVSETAYRTWELDHGTPRVQQVRSIAKYCGVSVGLILQDLGVLEASEVEALAPTGVAQAPSRAQWKNAQKSPVRDKQRKRAAGGDKDGAMLAMAQ